MQATLIYQLDLREYGCPLPLLIVKKALEKLDKGSILIIGLNMNNSLADFELLCLQQGYHFKELAFNELEQSAGYFYQTFANHKNNDLPAQNSLKSAKFIQIQT